MTQNSFKVEFQTKLSKFKYISSILVIHLFFYSQTVFAAPSIKNDDSIDDVRRLVKCFGDVFDELVGKGNKLYKHRLYIKNINNLLDRYEKVTLPDLKNR